MKLSDAAPAGTLIYIGSAVKTDTQTTTSTTPVDITGLSVTFTAKAATQYLYVFDGMVSASTTNFVSFLCDEAGTDVGLGAASSARSRVTRSCAPGVGGGYAGFRVISTPGAGSKTVKVQFMTSSGDAHVNRTNADTDLSSFPRAASTLEVYEIKA
jgi:hypothetical protein